MRLPCSPKQYDESNALFCCKCQSGSDDDDMITPKSRKKKTEKRTPQNRIHSDDSEAEAEPPKIPHLNE